MENAPDLNALKRLELRASSSFWHSSPHERGLRCNGAGAAGGIKVPNTMWGLDLKPIFDIHDWEYAEGGNSRKRLAADVNMMINAQLLIEAHTTKVWVVGPILRWLRGIRANTYYNAVRQFGTKAFHFTR
jgi:hypothetical protein